MTLISLVESKSKRPLSAVQTIHDLAPEHGVVHRRTRLDDLADAIAAHSGDAVELDETEWLLAALDRANVITGLDASKLHARYRRERRA